MREHTLQTIPYDINQWLHQARSALLREMPPGAERLLSAGCSGNWYFDWIEKCYGPVREHVGLEYYMPKPETLPPNVTWIANTASNMELVGSATCDLVFSGQNIEHLWPQEVSDFLTEAARVLKPGGYLVVDSPNRSITNLLNWSHPEHTIELTVDEIEKALELAGFDVTKKVGAWLCRDPRSKRILPFTPGEADQEWSPIERLLVAPSYPEDSFIWWLEARRNDREPQGEEICKLLGATFEVAWPERVRRLIVPPERLVESREDGDWVVMPRGTTGMAFFGPYMPLPAGRHRITFTFEPQAGLEAFIAICDVCVGPHATVLQTQEVPADMTEITLQIELPALQFGVQFRCYTSTGGFAVKKDVRLQGDAL